MKFNDAILGGVFLALSLAVLVNIQGFPTIPGQKIGPSAFPGLIAVGAWLFSPRHVANFAITVGALVFYIVAADTLGFLLCAGVILVALFLTLRLEARVAIPLAVCLPVVIHLIFYKLLKVPLPWGVLPVLW